ncbi:MAG: hypothetical protein JW714_01605 [Candidatus Omnitrophica bacterium]|nr:hypothetical protein [Candidatus Omnitrophota bacterium]
MSKVFRRQRVKIVLLLIVVLAGFVYLRKEVFFRQRLEEIIKQSLVRNLPCKISIAAIKPHWLYGLVLRDVEISFPQISGFIFKINVEQAQVKFGFRQLVSARRLQLERLRLIAPVLTIHYLPEAEHNSNSLAQSLDNVKLKPISENLELVLENGEVSFAEAQTLVKNLSGSLFFNQEGLYFRDINIGLPATHKSGPAGLPATHKSGPAGLPATHKSGPAGLPDISSQAVQVHGELTDKLCSLTVNLDHVQLGNFDVLTNVALDLNKRVDNNITSLNGSLKTYGSVLNNRPFPEVNSSFEIKESKLRILTLNLGEQYDLRGVVDLHKPFNADLSLNFYQTMPHQLIARLSPEGAAPNFSGLVNGLIKISGPIMRPKVEGYLEAKDGHLGELNYLNADIYIKGRYPQLLITDSRICREAECFIMEGAIDLASLGSQDSLQLDFKSDQGVLWQGWDITASRDSQMHMSKSVSDDFKVTFDAFARPMRSGPEFMDSQADAAADEHDSELGLEYKIFGDKSITIRLKKDEGVLGMERRVKF